MSDHLSRQSTLRVLAVWLPQGVSRAMSSATTVTLSLYLYAVTGSAQVLATVVAASVLASVWASPLVGGIADHLPKRLVLLAGNILLACLVGVSAAALLGHTPRLWLLYVAILASGALDAVVTITQQAAVRDVVSDAHLVRANALVTLLQSSPLVLGPALGAALYAGVGLWPVLAVDAASFVLAGLGALALPDAPATPRSASWLRLPFAGARQGLGTLWSDRDMRAAQLWYSLANVGNGLTSGILAAWILQRTVSPRAALGAFGTAGAVGMLACAALLATVSLPGARRRWVLAGLTGAAVLGRAPLLAVTGVVGVAAVGGARSFLLELSGAPLLAIWQQATPREVQGRVFGARRLLAQGPYPVAVWLGGWLAAHTDGWTVPDQAFPTWVQAATSSVGSPMGRLIVIGMVIELVAAVGLWRSGALTNLEERGA